MERDTRSGCGCHPYLGALGCSWERLVQRLPPTDHVRVAHEAGKDIDWKHLDWTGEACGCDCHDGDSDAP